MKSKIFLILLFATLFACAQKQKYVSIIESCEYKEALNRTEYMRFPYGKVYIDGKWYEKDICILADRGFLQLRIR